jgi:hypothetical protein
VFENRVLWKIFASKRGKVTGDWRKLHNEELHILKYSPSIITIMKLRKMRWAGHAASMVRTEACAECWCEGQKKRNTYKDLDLESNIKMDIRELEWSGMDGIDLVLYRDWWRALVNMVTNLRIP